MDTKKSLACLLFVLFYMSGYAGGDQMKDANQSQLQVDIVVQKLTNNEIGRIDVLQIPTRILTRARITPEMLDVQFHYRLTIHDVRAVAYRDQLRDAVRTIVVQPRPEMSDIRWGVVFYDINDARVGALYFDKTGRSGAVSDKPVSFEGKFFKWLEDSFSKCLR
jgi:hypothetical protein